MELIIGVIGITLIQATFMVSADVIRRPDEVAGVMKLLWRRKPQVLDITLSYVAKECGMFSEDLGTGVIDTNPDRFEPLRIISVDPNESQYAKPDYSKLPLSHYVTSTVMWAASTMVKPYDFGGAGRLMGEALARKMDEYALSVLEDVPAHIGGVRVVITRKQGNLLGKSKQPLLPVITVDLSKVLALPVGRGPLLLPQKTTRPIVKLLDVNFVDFSWLVAERHAKHIMFKVVGTALGRGVKDAVYLIGKDTHTGQPYVLRCPPEYREEPILSCVSWCINTEKLTDYVEI